VEVLGLIVIETAEALAKKRERVAENEGREQAHREPLQPLLAPFHHRGKLPPLPNGMIKRRRSSLPRLPELLV
jgi:hypothetical protein